jgi:hypothetical protein
MTVLVDWKKVQRAQRAVCVQILFRVLMQK